MSSELQTNPEYPTELPYQRVLDKGFVALVDVMGDDAAIVQAARVSYGKGTKTVRGDKALISYLMRHAHTTPFEMVEFKFLMRLPLFIARQVIRHRTACLAEGTEVYFDLPGGIERRGNQLYKLKIEDVWKKFQPTRNQVSSAQRNPYFRRDRVQSMRLRQVNEDTLRIQHTRVVDVYKNGKKPVFRVLLEDGKSIEATADHRFFFDNGWQTLKQATGLQERNGRAVWNSGEYTLFVNGQVVCEPAMYQDREWLDEQYNRRNRRIADIAAECGCSYHTIRKWLREFGIQRATGGRSQTPWNAGKSYRLGPREVSDEWTEANRRARSGPASNFWKGGMSSDRESIGRWTTQIAAKIHERNFWTCQLCGERKGDLHCHHVVPVWADVSLAREESNLTTLCADCHQQIHGRELEFTERLGGPPVRTEWVKKPRIPWNKLTVAKPVRIVKFEYIGMRETYDLEVEGPFHNFIANGIVTHNSVNEYSGRYSEMPDRFWAPDIGAIAEQDTVNRQGRADTLRDLVEALPDHTASAVACAYFADEAAVLVAADGRGISRKALLDDSHRAEFTASWSGGEAPTDMLPSRNYIWWVENLLGFFPERKARLSEIRQVYADQNERSYALYKDQMARGVAREIARCVLPLSLYTEWYWKIDLHNLLHFLRLRMDPHAQLEVRELAEAMASFVRPQVPFAWEAFEADRRQAIFLSREEKEVMRPADDAAACEVLNALHEKGYRSRRLKETARKFGIDERLVDKLFPPKQG